MLDLPRITYKKRSFSKSVDWLLILCYVLLIFIGWLSIYASVHTHEETSIFDFTTRSGMQFIWICISLVIATLILFVIPPHIYESIAWPTYFITLVLLVAVIFLGTETKGSNSWFRFGSISFQPAEISKIVTSITLATFMSRYNYRMSDTRDFLQTLAIFGIPMLIIVAENETGSALVYASFVFMLYREGLSGWVIILVLLAAASFITTLVVSPYVSIFGIMALVIFFCCVEENSIVKEFLPIFLPVIVFLGLWPTLQGSIIERNPTIFLTKYEPMTLLLIFAGIEGITVLFKAIKKKSLFHFAALACLILGIILTFSVEHIFNDVLKDHQRRRIEVLLGLKDDPTGAGYNINQSMIAIGSGGLTGKGYLQGTQTTFGFVPEQSTDFIFCTIGEQFGFVGCSITILLYFLLIWRIIRGAENGRERFTRIYGYCVAGILFMHMVINIGMTIGVMPVIGIPLPLISYGGSSLLAFTVMIFIFIALDRSEKKYF